jgi:site-specific DNA-methyltransferase (adenine-specific)
MKINHIYQGNVLDRIKDLEENSVQCVVTSPPYWGLRDYGTDDQLGLEETPEEYVENMVKVFREVKRVLKNDGTLWLNLGDSYNNTISTGNRTWGDGVGSNKYYEKKGIFPKKRNKTLGLKAKDLVGIPWRVAFALQQDGWYLRQDIIWHKPNPMPESVKDRCTKAHEYIFLLSKSPQYYYDKDAIAEKTLTLDNSIRDKSNDKLNNTPNRTKMSGLKTNNYETRNKRSVWDSKYNDIEHELKHRQGMHKARGEKIILTRPMLPSQNEFLTFIKEKTNAKILANSTKIPFTTISHWFRQDKTGFSFPSIEHWNEIKDFINDWSKEFQTIDEKMTTVDYHTDEIKMKDGSKNRRSVWKIQTKPYKEAHFAVFPERLPELCIKAGSKEGDIVLDPFFGSGTTGWVAQRLGRKWLGIEVNQEYIKIANKRFTQQELFT